jgi:Transposase IS4
VDEVQQHIGLYIWNGLSPSPRLEMKLQPQHYDPINGNDYIHRHMGPNSVRRHKHFRAFFACQDPRIDPPNRKKVPLFKVAPLIKWINHVGKAAGKLGMHASVDEQTIGFQGRHADKLRISYKAEGDGFQADTICEEGFTFAVHFRNEPPPIKYTSKGLSPLHSRVMWLFDQLTDNYHRVWMDNL